MTDDELKALADLLACPFCNGEAFTMAEHWRDGMMCGGAPICRSCGATMPRYWPKRSALSPITAWNTRANLPAIIEQRAEIERLRAVLQHYADTFCEGLGEVVGDFCGKCSEDECSGCKAYAALNPTGQPA